MAARSDNFTRAGTSSNIGTPSDAGSDWVQGSGTWGITNNKAYESTSTATSVGCYLESSLSSVTVQVTVTVSTGSLAGKFPGIIVRETDDNNYLVWLASASGGGIYKRVAGTFTLIAGFNITPVSGDVFKVTIDGSNLMTCYQNGSSVGSVTDATNSTATKHGLFLSGGANTDAVNFDDFSIASFSAATGRSSNLTMLGVS